MRLHLVPLLGLSLPLAAQQAPTPAAAAPALTHTTLDSLISANMAEAGIVGLAAAIVVDRKVVWERGYGFADWQRRTPVTTATPMSVASITKTVTGVAMMQLVQAGRLSLDADVNTYLPFRVRHPRFPDRPITLRQLATHTSGLTDRPAVYLGTYHWDDAAPQPLGRFLTEYLTPGGRLYDTTNWLEVPPGAQREYSNIGAGLAGFIVERVSGQSLPAYTRRHIFGPLGLRNTGWTTDPRRPRGMTTHFVAHNGHAVPIPRVRGTVYPDGGLVTSVHDLGRYFVALLDRGATDGTRILSPGAAAEMLRFQFSDSAPPAGYGPGRGNSGLFWRTKFGGRLMGHGGNDPGVQAEMLSDLTGTDGFVLLSNTSVGDDGQVAMARIVDALRQCAERKCVNRASPPPR